MARHDVTYGPGGFDPEAPDGNVLEDVEVPYVHQSLYGPSLGWTILAVHEVIPLGECALAAGVSEEVLVSEALAWSVA